MERGHGTARARWPKDDGLRPRVTPQPRAAHAGQPVPSATAPARPSSSSTASSGETGLTGQPGPELEAGDLAQPRMDLPVPVVGGIDLLAQAAPCAGRGCTADRRGWSPAARGPGAAPRRWRPRPAAWPGRNPPRAGAGRSTPRTTIGTRTARTRRLRRPPRPVAVERRDSSRTSRQNGHSPSRMTNRAAPPISSASRCGTWGRSYRSRHRWLVLAPAWAPQFWTTWR